MILALVIPAQFKFTEVTHGKDPKPDPLEQALSDPTTYLLLGILVAVIVGLVVYVRRSKED